jgi:Zn-dependent M28 family amino/carboxypeptidase
MKPLTALLLAVLGASCINEAAPRQPAAPAFDGERAFEHVKAVVAIGPRPAGSTGAQQTRAYITKQLAALGITTEEQSFDAKTPLGVVGMTNLRATLPGRGQGRLIIAGHYDTKIFKEFRFVGANDAGSSTGFLIELARALKGRTNPYPIELLFLDGEESVIAWEGTDHTYGSRYYVDAARRAGTLDSIRALILVDMIGDRELQIKREENSTPWLTDVIWTAARRLNRPEFVNQSTPIEDDHLEFLAAGIPAVDVIDLDYPTATAPSPYWHTADDTLDKMSARSLQVVGDVLLAALPDVEKEIAVRR